MEENRNVDNAGALVQQAVPRPQSPQVKGRVFVTVGSTPEARFDDLVETVTTPKCVSVLKKRDYTSLVIQRGNGRFFPGCFPTKCNDYFEVEHFGSRPNINELITDHIQAASLVISNAGAETIFKTLRAQRPLVVVLNKQFSGEYELEMAKQFSKFMYCCSPETLVHTLSIMDLKSLVPYPPMPPPFPVIADLNDSLRHFLMENKDLAPFQETVMSTISTPESPNTIPEPISSDSTNLKSQGGKGKKGKK
ncbi:unnamed protein product [Calypogeia fissa]